MSGSSFNPASPGSSAARVILQDVIRRRGGGERISDDEVLAGHPALAGELRGELRKLSLVQRALAVASGGGGSSDPATVVISPTPAAAASGAPVIAGYRVLREVGRGGQAVVYEALHESTRRRVAIKCVRVGPIEMSAGRARFEREVRVLAALRHPNIVAIHETGQKDDVLYFVMDFVDGLPLVRGPAGESSAGGPASSRAIHDCVHRFETICEAVHAAHLRGVIHRDLKPANIRVAADGQPMILDFGLAKLGEGELRDALGTTSMTEEGQFVGSLPWSSPEQAAGRLDDIDLRSDVYSLGVMLYQALTGRMPYETRAALPVVLRNIAEAAPPALRDTAAPNGRAAIDTDLDTIVRKSLAKEPSRRYQSAGDLAADLRRWRRGEAIDARRASSWYVARKLVARHRVAVGTAAAFVVLVSGSAIGLAIQAAEIKARARDAEDANRLAQIERDAAVEARDAEHFARMAAEQVAGFLGTVIGAADPFADPRQTRDQPLIEAVMRASERVENEIADQPEIEASIRTVLGRTLRELGEWTESRAHLDRAVGLLEGTVTNGPGEETPELRRANVEQQRCMSRLAQALHERAQLEQICGDFAAALADCERAMHLRTSSEEPLAVAESQNLMAHLLRETGRLEEARMAAESGLATRRTNAAHEPALIAESLNALGGVLRAQQCFDDAGAAYAESLALRRGALGNRHPDVATTLNNIAALRISQGRFDEAEPPLIEALSIYRERLGADHVYVVRVLVQLGTACARQGKLAESRRWFEEGLAVCERRAGAGEREEGETSGSGDDLQRAAILQGLGALDAAEKNWESAISRLTQALEIHERILGARHATTEGTRRLKEEVSRRAGNARPN